MMAKIERRKFKGQSSSSHEAVGATANADATVRYSLSAVVMPCLLLLVFLMLLAPSPSSAGLPTIETLPAISDRLNLPSGVAVGADEKIYVAESTENQVHIFSSSGQYLNSISGLDEPTAVTVDADGNIYIGNAGKKGSVEVYSSNRSLIGVLGSGNGEFGTPVGIAIDAVGLIYVVDKYDRKIKVYNADRSLNFSFGSKGTGNGQFLSPTAIAINNVTSEILVSDLMAPSTSARVQVFDLNGVFLRSFITTGTDELGETVAFIRPFGIAVDTLDRIYITDGYQNIVTVYDTLGNYLGKLYDNSRPLRNPQGIAFAPGTSRLFIASLNTSTVETFGLDRAYGSIAVSPESYNFGGVSVDGTSVVQSFNVSNTGNGKLLIDGVGGVTLTGANASEFSIVSDECAGITVAPAGGCAIDVKFKPASAGSKSATLAIASDDLYMPTLNVALGGNGEQQQYRLTVKKNGDGNGTVLATEGINCGATCIADYSAGSMITLSVAKDKDGTSTFTGWSGGCSGLGDCKVTMNQAVTVVATFNNAPVPVANIYTITASAGANGSISPAGEVDVNEGSTKTFTITANEGYRVADVTVDGNSVGAVGSYSFSNVNTNGHTISAEFTAVGTLLLSSIEMGEISVGSEWKRVKLSNTFSNPIVVAKPASSNDAASAVVQIRNVGAPGFDVRIREWDYEASADSGLHPDEQVSYVVMEQGSYKLENGIHVEAGQFDTGGSSVRFTQTFATAPVVTSSVTTNNDVADVPVIVQMNNVGTAGFDYALQEEEMNDLAHAAVEAISFIAWEESEGEQNGVKFEVGKITDALPEQAKELKFSGSYASSPRLIADLQTTNGRVANLRWKDKSATGVSLLIDQELSRPNPVSTSQETIGYLLLAAFDTDCDGLSDEDEVNIYGTDPKNPNTDGDGLLDGKEVSFWGAAWDDDNDGDGKINLRDMDSAGKGLRDYSNEPVGDGAPTVIEVDCAGVVVRTDPPGEGDSGGGDEGSDQEDDGSGSAGKGFGSKAVKLERDSLGFKKEGVKSMRKGAGFKPNGIKFKREGAKFNRN